MDAIRKLLGEGVIGEYAGPRAFFKTVAHPVYPTGTAYPEAVDEPNVYRARKLKNVAFLEEPGRQTLDYDLTDQYAHIFNLEPMKYIEEGAVVLCFREGGRWYTIDKVVEEKPCCKNYMFRGAIGGGGVQSFDLTLEALHGWYVYSDPAADYDLPFRTQESLSSPLTLPMTYEYPIPDAFMDVDPSVGFPDNRMPYDAARGWYISPSVTFLQIPGDPVYTGSTQPLTGRWYYADCVLGFWLDEEHQAVIESGRVVTMGTFRNWMNYVGSGVFSPDPSIAGFGAHLQASADPALRLFLPSAIDSVFIPTLDRTRWTIRALQLTNWEFQQCRPLLFSARDFWQRQERTGPDSPILYGPSGLGGPFWGVPAPIRQTEDAGNPMAIDLGGYAAPGSAPEHMIPPAEVEIYRGNRSIFEYFCVQFTAS